MYEWIERNPAQSREALESFQKGIRIWEEFARLNPDVGEFRRDIAVFWLFLGHLHRASDRPEEDIRYVLQKSVEVAEQLVRDFPEVLGHRRYLSGYYGTLAGSLSPTAPQKAADLRRRAVEILEEVVKEDPGVAEYRNFLAECWRSLASSPGEVLTLEQKEKYSRRSFEVIRKLSRERPNWRPASLERGFNHLFDLLVETGQFVEAMEVCNEFIELRPENAWGHVQRSRAYCKAGDYAKAIEDSTAALELAPKLEPAFYFRATAHRLSGEYDKALEDANTGLKIAPYNVWLRHNRGQTYFCMDELKPAADDFAAVVQSPHSDAMHWLSAAALLILCDNDGAYPEHCTKMIAHFRDRDKLEATEKTARACLLAPDVVPVADIPLEPLETALDSLSIPDDVKAWAWATRALAEYRRGHPDKAVEYVTEAAKSPTHETNVGLQAFALAVKALAQHELDRSNEAVQALDRAIEIIKENSLLLRDEGWHDLLVADLLCQEAATRVHGKDAARSVLTVTQAKE